MSDRDIDANYIEDWYDETTQCKNCTSFCVVDGKRICLTSTDKTPTEILEESGETPPNSHCDYFQAKD